MEERRMNPTITFLSLFIPVEFLIESRRIIPVAARGAEMTARKTTTTIVLCCGRETQETGEIGTQ